MKKKTCRCDCHIQGIGCTICFNKWCEGKKRNFEYWLVKEDSL